MSTPSEDSHLPRSSGHVLLNIQHCPLGELQCCAAGLASALQHSYANTQIQAMQIKLHHSFMLKYLHSYLFFSLSSIRKGVPKYPIWILPFLNTL